MSHPKTVRFSFHMCLHIFFSTVSNCKFFFFFQFLKILFYILCKMLCLIIYWPIQLYESFHLSLKSQPFNLLSLGCLGHAGIGVIIILIFMIWTLRKYGHNSHSVKIKLALSWYKAQQLIHRQSQIDGLLTLIITICWRCTLKLHQLEWNNSGWFISVNFKSWLLTQGRKTVTATTEGE